MADRTAEQRGRCLRCSCVDCTREGAGENHDHVCTHGPDCIEAAWTGEVARLRAEVASLRSCPNCNGEKWVCEDHPHVPWGDGDGCCGAAGAPCDCNPLSRDGEIARLRAALARSEAERERLRLFVASDVSRLVGYVEGVSGDGPILDDDPMDWIRRVRTGLRDEAKRVNARAALREEPDNG